MDKNKIVPSLWFCEQSGSIAVIIDYYKNIFGDNFIASEIVPLGTTPGGKTEICEVYIFGQKYSFMCTEFEHHSFNEALSFTIYCENQTEIDKFWNYFINEGTELQCGWCTDKYKLRWQVLPYNLNELMSKPNAWEVLMKQKKIIITEYMGS